MTVKLTPRQVTVIDALDSPRSQFVREAVEEKLSRDIPGYA